MDFNTDIKPIIAGQLRHLATIGATALAAHGWLASSKVESFEDAGAAALIAVAAMAWSAVQKFLDGSSHAQALAKAYAQVPPDVQQQLDNMAKLIVASPKAAAIIAGPPQAGLAAGAGDQPA